VDLISATRSEGVGLIARAIRFPTYVITNHQRYRQTDGRTDGRTTCDPKTAHMHLSALRGKNVYVTLHN